LTPDDPRTTLYWNVTSRTVDHGARAALDPTPQQREAALVTRPAVLEHVPLDEHPLRVLELQQVLDGPTRRLPAERLEEVVAPDLDVARHEPAIAGSAPPNITFSPAPSSSC
jgi:hypothetical protein